MKISQAIILLRTIRYLRPVQIFGRIWFKYYKPSPRLYRPFARRTQSGIWVYPAQRQVSMIGRCEFRFLNEKHVIDKQQDWDNQSIGKLWRYNLHYFDDLNAIESSSRTQWHSDLISRWIKESPPFKGSAWEPYPTSLRIINWIKWALAGHEVSNDFLGSLALQASWLSRKTEIHLLGNHLFVNAKALVYAGLFFDEPEAGVWLEKGLSILEREIPEQILEDGGQFERTTMYHALALEDMLDLSNIIKAYPDVIPTKWYQFISSWPELIIRMWSWLRVMCHPDNEISLFNDAAIGIAPSIAEYTSYMGRMGYSVENVSNEHVIQLKASGYIRLQNKNVVALLDVAEIGPDYLPGHAHADTLSFELSLFGQRVLVNSGTSCYGLGEERLRQRGTAAHNTVVIDGENSSEVWSGFRVARRARPLGLNINSANDSVSISCSHDGYFRLPGKPKHTRAWLLEDNKLEICDELQGKFNFACAYIHLHPHLVIMEATSNGVQLKLSNGMEIYCSVSGGTIEIMNTTYHPEFGLSIANKCLCINFSGSFINTVFSWN